MKKILSMLIIISLAVSSVAFAITEKIDIDKYLLGMGTPLEIVEKMSEEVKVDIVNFDLSQKEKGYFGGASITRSCAEGKENSNETTFIKEFDSNGDVVFETPCSKGTIDNSDLELIMTHYNYSNYISVHLNYKWLNEGEPFYRFQDPIAVTWDNDYFRYITGTFQRYDNAKEYTGTIIRRSGTTLSELDNEGLGWHADLIGPTGAYQSNYGYGKFQLEKKAASANTELYYKYAHIKQPGTFTINILGYGSVSFSGGSNYDTQANNYYLCY